MGKGFEASSSFLLGQDTAGGGAGGGGVRFLCFRGFMLVLGENSNWEWDWVLGYHSIKFWNFPGIS